MKMFKTVLVEDEKNNLDLLNHFIKKYCKNIDVIASCSTYDQALSVLKAEEPDLVFLDIVLDRDTSFDLLQELGNPDFQIIFTTAYDEYAIRAFKYNTIDYLLKPIIIEELVAAVNKVAEKINENKTLDMGSIKNISQSFNTKHPANFIMISGMDRIDFIHPDEVVYLKSTGRYTEFYLKDKKRKITSSKPIGEYENILDQDVFYRIHNSFLINLAQLININKRAGNYCEMSNGDSLPLSRRRYEGLMGYMRNR
ncbi:LytTR family DNA-binding domain-containing protein [Flavobacteriaceae bacterium]|jgi:two-component system LytT family response regulator|nr:LytTR family DNA-binding domain-containing protein [Flavobacteriaceae bacterium]MDA9887230.1 LytTR family DNA-binding domain-containing protein [Flavobacteriaceae bacterium]MDB4113115.1 LytTR family DNA-binding domain-containing protein [Flavobacteriaceae bacterium]MDB4187122.1 LytTR family DNA-binding domain-containing protein [Flavobacteriaceae bacterium]